MLIELLPGIHRCIGSEVSQTFKDTSTTHIIVIYGFKMSSCDAPHRDNIALMHSLERTRIPLAIVSPISGAISQANAVKNVSNCGSTQVMDRSLWIEKLVDLDGRALLHNMR